MSAASAPVSMAEEDVARAALYALIGRFFYEAPDAELLARIVLDSEHADDGSPLGATLRALADAGREADEDALREEHFRLFVGVGKAIVTPYTSAYVAQVLHERHLLALRQHVMALGFARPESASEPEDHAAALCDVMRHLIRRGESDQGQKDFFERFVYPGLKPLCEKLAETEAAHFYQYVARFALTFLDIEREAFSMLD